MTDSQITQEYYASIVANYMCKKYCKHCRYYMYDEQEQECTALYLTEDMCNIVNTFSYLNDGNV